MASAAKRQNGFLCYAHRGGSSPSRDFVEELQLHLDGIDPPHTHHAWCDQDLKAGDDWRAEIETALNAAAYTVLFVNIEFRASSFINEVELPALLHAAEREGLVLLPLLVGDCQLPDWLRRIQFVNHEAGPLDRMRRPRRDSIYREIADRVQELLGSGGQLPTAAPPNPRGTVHVGGTNTTGALLTETDGIGSTDAALTELVGALSESRATELQMIRSRYLLGERSEAIDALDKLIDGPGWDRVDAALRGRILRTSALYRLNFSHDYAEAAALAKRAASEDPDGDKQVLDAELALHQHDETAAARLLETPRSPHARHLRAAMLIEVGDAALALDILGSEIAETEADRAQPQGLEADETDANWAETSRLRALALLVLKHLPEALDAIDTARALAPDWVAMRSAAALIDFWRLCTPAALTLTDQPLWPMPFARALVRAGTGDRLAEIADRFATIAETMPPGSHEQTHWLTWRLVALLCSGHRGDDATRLARRLIEQGANLPAWALTWARFHGLDLDRDQLRARLRAITDDDPNLGLFSSLYVDLLLEYGQAEMLLDELDALGRPLESQGRPDVPRQWRIFALTANGQLDDAVAALDGIADEHRRLLLRLHIARAQEAKRPGSHKAAAAALYAAYPSADALAESCDAHASAGDWAYVAEHADELLRLVPTPRSLRLLVNARFHQSHYRRCMQALDEHRDVYADDRLPADLARLRVRCQRALGDPTEAVQNSRRLYDHEPTTENLVELLNSQLEAADSSGIRESLERLALIAPVDAHLLLQGVRIAAQWDRDLAIRLWRRAAGEDSDEPTLVTQTALLGNELGLDADEVGPWFTHMHQLAEAGDGPVQALHISELTRFLREQRARTEPVWDQLWHGEIPMHRLIGGLLDPLPVVLHADPTGHRAAPDPVKQRPTLIRNGARPLGQPSPQLETRPRLILDLTALITAKSLGLLELVEQAFAPLWLHRQWHLLLRAELELLRQGLSHSADEHAQLAQLIRGDGIDLADLDQTPPPEDALTEYVGEQVARQIGWAHSNGGLLLDYLPLHHPDIEHWREVDLPALWSAHVIGPRGLLDSLLAEGMIAGELHARALTRFPPEPDSGGISALPKKGSKLLASTTLLGQFAELALLVALSHRFSLHVPSADWAAALRQAENDEHRTELVRWTEELIDGVRTGLQDGRYQLLPAPESSPTSATAAHGGLDELLAQPGAPGDRLWVDDRCVNGFPSTGTMPIIGVVEVLDLLQSAGKLDDAGRFRWLATLRASNYRFIPLAADEIAFWLRLSRISDSGLLVPEELDVLARYWAACLYQGDALRLSPTPPHRRSELPFFSASRSAIDHALVNIWSNRRLNLRRKQQQADWLLDRLFVGLAGIQHLLPGRDNDQTDNFAGTDIGHLIANALVLASKTALSVNEDHDKAPVSDPEHYLDWLNKRFLEHRLRADPALAAAAAGTFRKLVVALLNQNEEPPWRRLIGHWMLTILRRLPSLLRDELQKDQLLMDRLGLLTVTVLQARGLELPSSELWAAIATAMRGKVGIVHSSEEEALSVRLISEPEADNPTLELADDQGNLRLRGYFEHSEVLSPERQNRLAALRRHPEWWDGEAGGAEAVERRLALIDNPARRMEAIERLTTASADRSYQGLAAQWQRDKRAHLDDLLPPPLQALLRYLRLAPEDLDPQPDSSRLWDRLAATIPASRGLFERLRRAALLPYRLPEAARLEFASLSPDEIDDLLSRLGDHLHGPTGRLHLIDLALGVAESMPAALTIAQDQLDQLLSASGDTQARLLIELARLNWLTLDSGHRANEPQGAASLVAAWAHAAFVADLMLQHASDATSLLDRLLGFSGRHGRGLYAEGGFLRVDLAWPWQAEPVDFVIATGAILQHHAAQAARLDVTAGRERILALASGPAELPSDLALLRSPNLLSDRLGCLWGGVWDEHLAAFAPTDDASDSSETGVDKRIELFFEQVTTEPMRADTWFWGTFVLGHAPLAPEYAERFDAIAAKLPLDELPKRVTYRGLNAIMDMVSTNASDRQRVVDCLLRWAAGIDAGDIPVADGDQRQEAEIRDSWIARLLNWSLTLAAQDTEDPDAAFARIIEGLMKESRYVSAYLDGPLRSITRTMPVSRHRALQKSLLYARARVASPVAKQRTKGTKPKHGPCKAKLARRRMRHQRKRRLRNH
ncbi:TIR domain-containing protein [Lamprobacter modestohalophilus]|uniref:TIR domain-containing protein n=1 Tax=Lamprobacter modestohalophilus TaxID=1064514 RepID=UPI002ADEF0FC|nr:TIR domain-containing protein [Lamprobacter modestohalophilus]MEA1053177.1 TIR domain-containing protein [Lamprobacter modestohalophilus]